MRDNKWKYIVGGATFAFLIVALSLPLRMVPVEIVEMYYEMEMKQESYVVDEPYITEEMHEKSRVIFEGFRYTVPNGIEIPLYIDKPDSRVIISYESPISGAFYIYSSSGHIVYERLHVKRGSFEMPLPKGDYKAVFRESTAWGEAVHLSIIMRWPEIEEITNYKEVVKYREVPVQTEKQRITTKYEKGSTWELIFGN